MMAHQPTGADADADADAEAEAGAAAAASAASARPVRRAAAAVAEAAAAAVERLTGKTQDLIMQARRETQEELGRIKPTGGLLRAGP